MKFDMVGWKESLFQSSEKQAIPIMTYPGLEFNGGTILDIVTNGEKQYECIKALADNYPTAASVMVMDLSVEVEAFGAKIHFHENDTPDIMDTVVNDCSSIENLKVPKVGSNRTIEFIHAAKLASENINDKPVFGGSIGPFSLAVRLFDMTEFMTFILIEPSAGHKLVKKANEFLVEYIRAYKNVGANGVIIAEPAAGLLPPLLCDEFSSNYIKKIVDELQDDNFSIILHNCGNTENLIETMLSTNSFAYHFGNSVSMTNIIKQIPKDIPAMGNLDPVSIFKNGSTQDVKVATDRLLNEMNQFSNFIISSGCDIPYGTPKKNIDTFFNVVKNRNN
jgi:uroporphyrinogen decarboxylase